MERLALDVRRRFETHPVSGRDLREALLDRPPEVPWADQVGTHILLLSFFAPLPAQRRPTAELFSLRHLVGCAAVLLSAPVVLRRAGFTPSIVIPIGDALSFVFRRYREWALRADPLYLSTVRDIAVNLRIIEYGPVDRVVNVALARAQSKRRRRKQGRGVPKAHDRDDEAIEALGEILVAKAPLLYVDAHGRLSLSPNDTRDFLMKIFYPADVPQVDGDEALAVAADLRSCDASDALDAEDTRAALAEAAETVALELGQPARSKYVSAVRRHFAKLAEGALTITDLAEQTGLHRSGLSTAYNSELARLRSHPKLKRIRDDISDAP